MLDNILMFSELKNSGNILQWEEGVLSIPRCMTRAKSLESQSRIVMSWLWISIDATEALQTAYCCAPHLSR